MAKHRKPQPPRSFLPQLDVQVAAKPPEPDPAVDEERLLADQQALAEFETIEPNPHSGMSIQIEHAASEFADDEVTPGVVDATPGVVDAIDGMLAELERLRQAEEAWTEESGRAARAAREAYEVELALRAELEQRTSERENEHSARIVAEGEAARLNGILADMNEIIADTTRAQRAIEEKHVAHELHTTERIVELEQRLIGSELHADELRFEIQQLTERERLAKERAVRCKLWRVFITGAESAVIFVLAADMKDAIDRTVAAHAVDATTIANVVQVKADRVVI